MCRIWQSLSTTVIRPVEPQSVHPYPSGHSGPARPYSSSGASCTFNWFAASVILLLSAFAAVPMSSLFVGLLYCNRAILGDLESFGLLLLT